ncbi:MAG: class I SAM-dependent methyltransferase [Beijerinckiaceae bacterium]
MFGTIFRSTALAAVAVIAVSFSHVPAAYAQAAKDYAPTEGQDGKDVIWLPTASTLVDKMLNMAKITPQDFVIDLGSGDGRTVITAARRGTAALGIEYNPEMVEFAKKRAAAAGVAGKASFMKADIFESDFSKASVITMFLLPEINMRLRPKLLALKPGTRIVSNSFDMEDWRADQVAEADSGCVNYCIAYMWIVPANFAGSWKTPDGELKLTQKFQYVSGTFSTGNVTTPIKDGKVSGDVLAFSAGGKEYSLKIGPDGLEGLEISSKAFKATRSNP